MYNIDANIEHLYKNYAKALVFFATRLVHDKQAAQDVCSKVWTKLLEWEQPFELEVNVKAFLYTAVKYACFDYLKTNRNSSTRIQVFAHTFENTDDDALTGMIHAELLRKLTLEIEKLTGNYKIVCKLIFLEGLTNLKAAEVLKMPVSTVKNIKFLAINKLKYTFLNYG